MLVAINGKPLPRGASAEELQDLVRSNPKYALAAVDALLWRARAAAGGGAPAGGELCVHCGAGAAGVTWARVAFPGRAALGRRVRAAAAVGGRAARLHVRPGDVLVGLNHEPVPRRHAAAALLQRFSSAAARGALTLNLWRCHDADVLDEIRRQCAAAEARSLAVDPSVAARLPRARAARGGGRALPRRRVFLCVCLPLCVSFLRGFYAHADLPSKPFCTNGHATMMCTAMAASETAT